MRRVVLILASAAIAVGTAACGGGEVVVVAQREGISADAEAPQARPLPAMPVRLFPFDRSVVFDSLAQAFPDPEPEIPDSIFDLQQRVIEQQRRYQEANAQWGEGRERLQALSDTLRAMSQSSGEYFALFQEFGDLEGEVNRLEREANESFAEFDRLQTRLNQQSREIRLARRNWADEAFTRVDSIFAARQKAMGREVQYDTTNAQGGARFTNVPEGQWWVVALYDRQFDELYWNVPINVEGGAEPVQVRLTEENAEVRQKL